MGSQKRSALSRFQAGGRAWWETAISDVAPGSIVLRGHRVEDLIGSMSYAGIVGLLVGNRELSEAQARLLEAALVAGVDHGVRAPSIAAARMAATCGIPLNCAVATGLNMLGDDHGGAAEQCMEMIFEVTGPGTDDMPALESRAQAVVDRRLKSGAHLPGFGHQLHKLVDPRRAPLLRLVDEAVGAGEIPGHFARVGITLETALSAAKGRPLTMNIDGVTAVIYCELGFPALAAKGLFCLSRGVGLVAHALEEVTSGTLVKGPCPPGDDLVRYTGPPPPVRSQ